jgi:hypothetical protein
MAKEQQRGKVRRKEKKNIASGVAHVSASFNNTMITITDAQGNTIAWSSSGTMGFKGSRWRVIIKNPAPLRTPFIPSRAVLSFQISLLVGWLWDPGDAAGKRFPFLNSGDEIVAEKSSAGHASGKVFAEMRKTSHSQHRIQCEIKKVEIVGVHDIIEELRKRRAKPTPEICGREGILIWTA